MGTSSSTTGLVSDAEKNSSAVPPRKNLEGTRSELASLMKSILNSATCAALLTATRTRSSWTRTPMHLLALSLSKISQSFLYSFCGVRLGGAQVVDSDELLEEAVQLAKDADVTIAFVGLNAEWETEGYDRKTLDLPGRTNELVERVAEANPNTVVVTQSVRISTVCSKCLYLSCLCYRDRLSPCPGRRKSLPLYMRGISEMHPEMPSPIFSSESTIPPASYRSPSPRERRTCHRSATSTPKMEKYDTPRIFTS